MYWIAQLVVYSIITDTEDSEFLSLVCRCSFKFYDEKLAFQRNGYGPKH